MSLRTFFTIEINGLNCRQEYTHYPSEEEIEEQINLRFPEGYIYDQFANEKIFPVAKVNKNYTLIDSEEI